MTQPDLPPAGDHGGDGPAIAAALGLDPRSVLDLSQNMNPYASPVADLVVKHLDAMSHYPDASAGEVLLAQTIGVDPNRLILTNGGSEAIHLVASRVGGQVRSEPEFGLHPRLGSGPIWRSNPHSPTGVLAAEGETADVWDEAFYALATGRWSAAKSGIVVGSLTKTFTCPGLRLGYLILPEGQDPAAFRACQPHWSVSALALAVLPELLATADLPGWSARIAQSRRELVGLLKTYGLRVRSGDAPWVLVSGAELRTELAAYGIAVRDCTSFGMPGVFRVAVPDADGLSRVSAALEAVG